MIFDGKAFAKELEAGIVDKVRNFAQKPKIVSVLVGDDPASVLYTRLKKQAAERVGVGFEINHLNIKPIDRLKRIIAEIGVRVDVTGLMVQMPLPGLTRDEQQEAISAIPLDKDVDGLRWEESGVMPATVRAILSILEEIAKSQKFRTLAPQGSELWGQRFVVVGTHGSVGRPLVHFLRERGVSEIAEVNSGTVNPSSIVASADVVISCVGKPGLVKVIKKGAIVIDVGISEVEGKVVGDMTNDVYNAASVAVPVPGGVGPVTVISLMQNAYELSKVRRRKLPI